MCDYGILFYYRNLCKFLVFVFSNIGKVFTCSSVFTVSTGTVTCCKKFQLCRRVPYLLAVRNYTGPVCGFKNFGRSRAWSYLTLLIWLPLLVAYRYRLSSVTRLDPWEDSVLLSKGLPSMISCLVHRPRRLHIRIKSAQM
jgi:hypothetical protein